MPCNKSYGKRKYSKGRVNFGKPELRRTELKKMRIKAEVLAAKRVSTYAHSRKGKLEKKLSKATRTVKELQRKVDNIRKSPFYKETKRDIKTFRKKIPRGKKDDPFDMDLGDFDMQF